MIPRLCGFGKNLPSKENNLKQFTMKACWKKVLPPLTVDNNGDFILI